MGGSWLISSGTSGRSSGGCTEASLCCAELWFSSQRVTWDTFMVPGELMGDPGGTCWCCKVIHPGAHFSCVEFGATRTQACTRATGAYQKLLDDLLGL